MTHYCKEHIKNPIKGYSACPSCEIEMMREEEQQLKQALHDAIRRPMGVVPDSALKFYAPDEYYEGRIK